MSSAGTSFLIEDVACPVNRLADMTVDLGNMFHKHGYEDASCFGHALEGNLHLVFSQASLLLRPLLLLQAIGLNDAWPCSCLLLGLFMNALPAFLTILPLKARILAANCLKWRQAFRRC